MAARAANRFFVWIIVILLFIGLLGFGAGGFSTSLRSIGTVGDQDISIRDYQSQFERQMQNFRRQFPEITPQQARNLGLDQSISNQLVTTALFDQATVDLNLSVGDQPVYDQITALPNFKNLSGNFDTSIYKDALQRANISERDFETNIRSDLARGLVQSAVTSGLEVPKPYTQSLTQYANERRTASWTSIDSSHISQALQPATQDDLDAFYDAHHELFTTQQERQTSYAWLSPDMLADTIEIDEASARELYEERINDFVQPERRIVERLVFSTQNAAQDASDAIQKGDQDFEALVKERGLSLSDIDLGDMSIEELGDAGAAIFEADNNSVVGPLKTNLGPAIFRINAILSQKETLFEDVKADLISELSISRARRSINDYQDEINDLLAGGATLTDLAKRTPVQTGEILWHEGIRDGIAAYDAFQTAVRNSNIDGYPEIIELSDGGIVLIKVTQINEPQLQDSRKIANDILQAFNKERIAQAVLDQAKSFAKELNAGQSYEGLGLAAKEEAALSRRSFVQGAPQTFAQTVFSSDTGHAQAIKAGDRAIIVRADAVSGLTMDDTENQEVSSRIEQATQFSIAQDLLDIMRQELQRSIDVSIDEAAINAFQLQAQ